MPEHNERNPIDPHARRPEEVSTDSTREVVPSPIDQVAADPLAEPRRRSGSRSGRGQEKRRRHQAGERPVERQRPPAEIAREIYRRFTTDAYEIVYNPDVERPATEESAEPEEIAYEHWSFAAAARVVATSSLQFRYEKPSEIHPAEGVKKNWRAAKVIEPTQTLPDHLKAREAVRELMTERYSADQARLATLIEQNHALNKGLPQAEAVQKEAVKTERRGTKQVAVPLSEAMDNWQTSLAKKRWEVMMDAVDWFGARVAQVENSIKTLTKGGGTPLTERVKKLDTDPNLKTDLQALAEDIKMLEVATALEVPCAKPEDQKWVKTRLEKQLGRARYFLQRVHKQLEIIRNIAEPNQEGLNKIAVQRRLVAETFLTDFSDAKKDTIGRRFIAFAELQLADFSPEEELNFWEAFNERCDEIAPRPRPGTPTYNQDIKTRLGALNEAFKIYRKEAGGAVINHSLAGPDGAIRTPADEETPIGVEQLVLRAKADAQLLGELRQTMRKTFALMGKEFSGAVRRGLHGSPNAEKVDMVKRLNDQLSRVQTAAVETLKKSDTTFAEQLKGREPRQLKWSNKDDRALLDKVRVQLYQELQLGTPNKINVERLKQLIMPAEAEQDVAAANELAAEARAAKPALDTILSKELDPAVLANLQLQGESANADKVAEVVRQLIQRLTNALQSGQLRDAFKQHFDQFVVEGGLATSNDLKAYLASIQGIVIDCERLQESLGPKWATEVGLITAGTGKKDRQVNVERVRAAFNELSAYSGDFIGALCLEANETARKAILSKVDASALDILNKLAIENEDTAFILLCVLPRLDEETAAVELKTAGIRLANFLKLGNPGERGLKLLEKRGLYVAAGDEAGYQMNTIQTLLQDGQFDHPAA